MQQHEGQSNGSRQAALMEVARIDTSDWESALKCVTETVSNALAVERVSIWLFDAGRSEIQCQDLYRSTTAEHGSGATLRASDFPDYFQALRQQRTVAATDARTHPDTREFRESYLEPLGITSMLDVPIWHDGEVAGVICHEHTGPAREWSREEQDFAASVAEVVSRALEASERRRAEQALSVSETRFRAMFEQSPVSVQILSPDGITLQVNRAFEQLFGVRREDLEGHNLLENDQVREQGIVPYLQRGFAGEVTAVPPILFDPSRIPGVGSLPARWIEAFIYPVKDPDGTIREVIIVHQDVTEHKCAEEALCVAREELEARVQERTAELEQSEEQNRLIINTALDAVVTMNADGRIMSWNAQAEAIFGWTAEEALGQRMSETIIPHQYREAHEKGLARYLQTGEGPVLSQRIEITALRRDGTEFPVELAVTPVKSHGHIAFSAFVRDITGPRLAADELRAAKEAAEEANRAKSEFLSRMSHELRTPMNSILGFAQLLARKSLPPDQQRGVEHILKAGRHLLKLINEVLDIARIEADHLQLSLEPVSVVAIVHEVVSLVQPLATQYGCHIENAAVHCPPARDSYVLADHQRLTQVLLNLLTNAVKYNTPSGKVQISCEEAVPALDGTERLRINVRDTGPGIPEEKLQRLFVPFDRLGAEQSHVEGTGLGLALSKRLVEAMGGSIDVKSTPRKGSTFSVELARVESPLERLDRLERTTRAADSEPASEPVEKTATILYIEDNLANLSLIETILAERPAVALVSALQGRIGLDLAAEHRPQLVLLDLHLPDLAGEEVLKRLQSDERTREIPVVVISADATPGQIERLLRQGAHSYLTKPLDVEQFLDTVDTVLAAAVKAG